MLGQEIQSALRNAYEMANENKEAYVTLDYLLFSLCEEKSAAELMSFYNVNVQKLRNSLRDFIIEHNYSFHRPPNLQTKLQENTNNGGDRDYPKAKETGNKQPQSNDKDSQRQEGSAAYNNLDKNSTHLTVALQRVLERAEELTKLLYTTDASVTGDIVLLSMLEEEDSNVAYLMNAHGIHKESINEYLMSAYQNHQAANTKSAADNANGLGSLNNLGASKNSTLVSEWKMLESFTVNLNKELGKKRIDPLVGRVSEMKRLMQILSRQRKNNPLLIGDGGVGKTAMVHGLVSAIEEGEVPSKMLNCEIYSLDAHALISGTRYRGEFEKRIKSLVQHMEMRKDSILFLDDIHSLIGAGSSNIDSLDVTSVFKPLIMSEKVRCIGTTTYDSYKMIMKKDLTQHFQTMEIKPMSSNEIRRVLEVVRPSLEQFHNVIFDKDAIKTAIELSDRYIGRRQQPDKAITVLDEAGASANIESNANMVVGGGFGAGGIGHVKENIGGVHSFLFRMDFKRAAAKRRNAGDATKNIGKDEIRKTVANMTGMPLEDLKSVASIDKLDAALHKNIFGQDQAINELVGSVKLARAGLNQPNRPLGCFMLTGPTGVGKTEVCKQLAEHSGINLIRYDMSEYSESHAVARLIGAPPGYVGFDNGSQLASAILKSPYSIVLFDEMEKAHPNIYNLLLQIMDYGYLTDNTGYKCDFRNTMIIVTTNAGATDMQKRASGFSGGDTYDSSKAVMDIFSPEFRNRLDSIIEFAPLTPASVEKIVAKFIQELKDQVADKNIALEIDAATQKHLAKKGYDPLMGARPLLRIIKEEIKIPLADIMLTKDIESNSKDNKSKDGKSRNGKDKDEPFRIRILANKGEISLVS